MAGFFAVVSGSGVTPKLAGWGGRIRTSVWRNQNPLPYHLATPQHGGARRTIPGGPVLSTCAGAGQPEATATYIYILEGTRTSEHRSPPYPVSTVLVCST